MQVSLFVEPKHISTPNFIHFMHIHTLYRQLINENGFILYIDLNCDSMEK